MSIGQNEISDVKAATGHTSIEDIRVSLLTRLEAAEDTIRDSDSPLMLKEARRNARAARAALKLIDSGKAI